MTSPGRYRIHAVSEITGVPEATLRAWERRYAVPVPVRTPSGYRLYSQKDVDLVKRMRELCANGMAPVDAAKMVAEPGQPRPSTFDAGADPYDAIAARIADATRRMDPVAIDAEVRLAMTLGDAATVVERAFCPALAEIGRDWERGAITVGHEHLASDILSAATRSLLRLLGPSRPQGEVVLACFAEEEHVLPLYAAAFRFVEWGYRPHVLGARTPAAGVGAAIREIEPAFVGLSLTMAPPEQRASELVESYAAVMKGHVWGVGGAAALAIQSDVEAHGGHVLFGGPDEQREQLGKLLLSTRGNGQRR
ncbi:MAG: Transcriptional regulator, MerR family protein [Myxococcaceae bacterium]|nr:Transcriptional regulator, MerR family protein [Myxococcaceae bacterium]